MKVNGVPYRTIRPTADGALEIIDQTRLPGEFVLARLATLEEVAEAIRAMRVRGAPLIGVAAAYGLALGLRKDASDAGMAAASQLLLATRPTAIDLSRGLVEVASRIAGLAPSARADAAWQVAAQLADAGAAASRSIGEHGAALLRPVAERLDRPLAVMTHCNAGWLATVDYGTALAPVYLLHDAGIPVSVWVSETRPRNQGLLTAWELSQHGVPCRLVVDSACGHLLQRGAADAVLVGTDRTTRTGDVTNKIGTYMKALAAKEAGVPFYVAAPSTSIDWSMADGSAVPIEERAASEVSRNPAIPVSNPAFDVTPARLVTAIITERGTCPATLQGLAGLFPERVQ